MTPWMEVATEVLAVLLAATVTTAVGWIARSIRDLRNEISLSQSSMDSRLDKIEGRLVLVEELERHDVIGRLGAVERSVATGAGQDQLRRIHKRIDESQKDHAGLGKEVSSVAGEVKAIHATVQVIQKLMMDAAK